MGLQDELGLTIRPSNAVQRGNQQFAATRLGSWLYSRSLHFMDRALFRATRGRFTLAEQVAGQPVILVSTIGARSGEERTVPLNAIPFEDDLALIGSNWGGANHPAWVHNLAANPTATVKYRSREVPVAARVANEKEAEQVFETAAGIYLGYPKYRERASHREIRVFILQPKTKR